MTNLLWFDEPPRSLAPKAHGRQYVAVRGDSEFHRFIASATENGLLTRLVNNALDLTGALRMRDVPMSAVSMRCADDHVQIAAAIADPQVDRARSLVIEHINVVRDKVLAEFNAPQSDEESEARVDH